MSKRSFIQNITPLPPSISRDAAIAHLHDHHAMIELNPLVLRHEISYPPPNAADDEAANAIWYEITDRINYLPGGAVKGEVVYKACFYNLPRGLQTHVFAPGGVDIRSKWSVGGSMPGEPREPPELGVDLPREGLYIKEEVELRCNFLMTSFVKKNLKRSHLIVADKIVERVREIQGGFAQPPASLWERPASRTLGRDNGFKQGPSILEQGPSSRSHRAVHYSYPPHCACEGTTHERSCSFFHPDDITQDDLFRQVQQYKSKPFYAISLPSNSSYSQPSSRATTPDMDRRYPRELVGSPAKGQCLCTGALHGADCSSYPGLRTPLSPSSFTTDSIQQPRAAFYGVDSDVDAGMANRLKARRPSDVAERAAARSLSQSDSPLDRDMIPAPLRAGRYELG